MQKRMKLSIWVIVVAGICLLGLLVPLLVGYGETPNVVVPATVIPTATPTVNITSVLIYDGTGPAARTAPQFAYNAPQKALVLFGGKGSNGYFQDTWTWDVEQFWVQQHPATSPGPVLGASMAYDDTTGLVVFFGGSPINDHDATNDTWSWNGQTWTLLHPSVAPPARRDASLIYDEAMGQLVLFGGYGTDTNAPLNDTWTWDGTTWTQLHPANAPSARYSMSSAYDPVRHTIVLFGGDDMSAAVPLLTDTWTWDGTTWTQQHPANAPETRFTKGGVTLFTYPTQTTMTLDETARQVLLTLVGGDNAGKQNIQQSWTWDGTTWVALSTQRLPIQNMCLFYDIAQHAVYGYAYSLTGSAFEDTLWQWNGRTWQVPVA